MQSIALFGCLFRCLLPIVFYCSLLFYMPLPRYYKMQFVLTRLATCHFTPVICLFHYQTWPLRFAQFSIIQWKTTIFCYRWRISTFKSSKTPAQSHHLSIWLIIIRELHLPFMSINYPGTAYLDAVSISQLPGVTLQFPQKGLIPYSLRIMLL